MIAKSIGIVFSGLIVAIGCPFLTTIVVVVALVSFGLIGFKRLK